MEVTGASVTAADRECAGRNRDQRQQQCEPAAERTQLRAVDVALSGEHHGRSQTSFTNGQRTGAGGRPYVNGNREEANNFLLDGVDNNNNTSNMISYQPNVDAIEEFRMITTNASAEFGNFQGAVVNVFLKSGTNQLHGTAFEFLRNNVLNANSWAANWQGLPRAAIRHNVFGGTGRRTHHQGPALLLRRLPGHPPRQSGRGELHQRSSRWISGKEISRASARSSTILSASTAANVRLPFPGNQIPLSMIDPVAKNLFNSPVFIRCRSIAPPGSTWSIRPAATSGPTRAMSRSTPG